MSKKPILFTLLAMPAFIITSTPLGFIAGVMAGALPPFTSGTVDATVGAGNGMPGIIVGVTVGAIYVLFCTYATWQYCNEEFGNAAQ